MPRSSYSFSLFDQVVAIVDHDNGKSVTNDVRAVLSDLQNVGLDLRQYRVIYRDTRHVWDEIVLTADGTFLRFRSIGAETLQAALDFIAQ